MPFYAPRTQDINKILEYIDEIRFYDIYLYNHIDKNDKDGKYFLDMINYRLNDIYKECKRVQDAHEEEVEFWKIHY